jgi:ketosteroid isomerase-like protein
VKIAPVTPLARSIQYTDDDAIIIDHRVATPLGRERDRETLVAQLRSLVDQAADVRFDYAILADIDEVVAARARWHGHLNEGTGEFETPFVLVVRRRGEATDHVEMFESDDDAGWVACVGEQLGERGVILAPAARFLAAHRARDWEAYRDVFSSDATLLDHRRTGFGEIHGWEAIRDHYRRMVELAPDARGELAAILDIAPRVSLNRSRVYGHAPDGGAFELLYLQVGQLRDGLIDRLEFFDDDAEDEARRRFVELAGGADLTPNERLALRFTDAFHARDWAAFRACLADDLVRVDHRVATALGRECGLETYEAQIRALVDQASDVRFEYEFIADLDDVAAARGGWRGHLNEGGGEFETPLIFVIRRRADRFARIEVFDPDDDAAWCARVGELLGERGATFAVWARAMAAQRDRDWEAYRGFFAPKGISI